MSLPTLEILSVSAVAVGLRHAVAKFQKETGIQCKVHYQTSTQMRGSNWQTLPCDLVITSQALALERTALGNLVPRSRIELGGVGVGIVVHQSVTFMNPQNTSEFINLLELANTVVYNQASSGLYFESLFQKLGVLSMVEEKAVRVIDGEALLRTIAQPPQDEKLVIGLGAVSEILEVQGWGIKLAAELPQEIQHVTTYEALAASHSANKLEVQAFLRSLEDPEIKAVFTASGVRPQ